MFHKAAHDSVPA